MIDRTFFAVVRNAGEGDYILPDEMSCDPGTARDAAVVRDQRLPGWAQANPVKRVAKVRVTEVVS